MTQRQMAWESEKQKYNAKLKMKTVKYLDCDITYQNPCGYAYYQVTCAWDLFVGLKQFGSVVKAKTAIKAAHEKYQKRRN